MPQAGRIRCLPSVPTGPILPACFFVVGERRKGQPVNNLQSEGRIGKQIISLWIFLG